MLTKALKPLVLGAALAALVSVGSAQAQFATKLDDISNRNEAVVQEMANALSNQPGPDHSLAALRYGADWKKPVGQYECQPEMRFKSAYKDAEPLLQAQFAYDLYQHLKAGEYDYAHARLHENKRYMPFEKQRTFAEFWFLRNDKNFKTLSILNKDAYLNDALVDATNIWTWYDTRNWNSSDYVFYKQGCIQNIMAKKP
jgi:hypothetical protein